MRNKWLFAFSALLMSSILFAGCAQTGENILRVATDATWPPFEFVEDESKEIIGLDIELMNAVAAKAGLEIEFVNVSFDTLLTGMAQCQYDMAISAITITPDRAVNFNFSAPYFQAGQIVAVGLDNDDIKGPSDLNGRTVGVQIDTTGDYEAQKIVDTTIRRYDDIGLAFQDLMNGQLEAVIADYPMALGMVGKNPGLLKIVGDIFTDENYGIAVCKNDTELLEQINSALADLITDGYVTELTQTWIVGGGE